MKEKSRISQKKFIATKIVERIVNGYFISVKKQNAPLYSKMNFSEVKVQYIFIARLNYVGTHVSLWL